MSYLNLNTVGSRSIGFSIFRILLSFLVIRNMFLALPMAPVIYGNNAVEPFSRYVATLDQLGLGWLQGTFDLVNPSYYLWLIILVSFLYAIGIGKWISGTLLYLLILNLQWRNPMVLSGADNVILVTLPFLIIGDNFKHVSYNWPVFSFEKNPSFQWVQKLAAVGFMLQVSIIYFVTGVEKALVDLWQDGIANYYILQLHEFEATKWNVLLAQHPVFVKFTTYTTLLFELLFPFVILFKRPKYAWLLLGVSFHLGIWFFMRIDVFPWIMMATYFVFLSDKEYHGFWRWFKTQTGISFQLQNSEKA